MGIFRLAAMAWRNLWRQKRRTLITISSIVLATFLAVMMIGMNDRSWEDVINTAARIGGGHITLQNPEYQDKPGLNRSVQSTRQKLEAIKKLPHVEHVLQRIVGQTMLSTTSDSAGAGFIAYDPALEGPDTLSILEAVKEGQLFATADDKGIILGQTLAKNLGAKMGSKVVYTLTDKQGEIVSGMARVSGIVHTGSPSVDRGLCFLPIDAMRKTLAYAKDESTQMAVFIDSQRRSADVRDSINAILDDGTVALTWKQTQPDLASFIAMKKGGGTFFSVLMLLLCAAGIFNTLFVSVMERLREFGILLAVGLSPRKLFSLVMIESLWLGLIGLLSSAVVVAWPYYSLATKGLDMTEMYLKSGQKADVAGVGMSMILHVGLYPESLLAIIIAVLSAVLLSGLYPAYKAGTVEPVEVIKLV